MLSLHKHSGCTFYYTVFTSQNLWCPEFHSSWNRGYICHVADSTSWSLEQDWVITATSGGAFNTALSVVWLVMNLGYRSRCTGSIWSTWRSKKLVCRLQAGWDGHIRFPSWPHRRGSRGRLRANTPAAPRNHPATWTQDFVKAIRSVMRPLDGVIQRFSGVEGTLFRFA
jgi:hypothetical protein